MAWSRRHMEGGNPCMRIFWSFERWICSGLNLFQSTFSTGGGDRWNKENKRQIEGAREKEKKILRMMNHQIKAKEVQNRLYPSCVGVIFLHCGLWTLERISSLLKLYYFQVSGFTWWRGKGQCHRLPPGRGGYGYFSSFYSLGMLTVLKTHWAAMAINNT